MARKSLIAKEVHRARKVKNTYEKRQELKKIVKSWDSTPEEKQNAMMQLDRLPRNGSPIRLRNRCTFTGRPRGYYRKFGISRLCLREMALAGLIPGMTKSSW